MTTIKALHDKLVNKEISAVELAKATLKDIKDREGKVDSFITITEDEALAQAAAIDERGIDASNPVSGFRLRLKTISQLKGLINSSIKNAL